VAGGSAIQDEKVVAIAGDEIEDAHERHDFIETRGAMSIMRSRTTLSKTRSKAARRGLQKLLQVWV